MTATVTHLFRSERTPAQKAREREQKLSEDVKRALPGIAPLVVAKTQAMARRHQNRCSGHVGLESACQDGDRCGQWRLEGPAEAIPA